MATLATPKFEKFCCKVGTESSAEKQPAPKKNQHLWPQSYSCLPPNSCVPSQLQHTTELDSALCALERLRTQDPRLRQCLLKSRHDAAAV